MQTAFGKALGKAVPVAFDKRKRSTRSGIRGKFEEHKHPRGPGGKFRDKPDQMKPVGTGRRASFNQLDQALRALQHSFDNANSPVVVEVRGVADKVAKDLGYDPELIKVVLGNKKFKVGDKVLTAGAFANLDTGEIVVFANATTPRSAPGMIAHEITHQKYESVRSVMASFWSGKKKQLIAEDGVSDYSRKYWNVFTSIPEDSKFNLAVHETLAEIGKLSYTKDKELSKVSQLWQNFYYDVNEAYTAKKEKRVPVWRGPKWKAPKKVKKADDSSDDSIQVHGKVVAAFLDDDFKPVAEEQATIVKVTRPNQLPIFLVPVEEVSKKVGGFKGGKYKKPFAAQQSRFDPNKHPRDEFGRFIHTPDKPKRSRFKTSDDYEDALEEWRELKFQGYLRPSEHWSKAPREIGHAAGTRSSGHTFTVYDQEDLRYYDWIQIQNRLQSGSKVGGLKTIKVNGMEVSEKWAIDEYTGSMHDPINKVLRKGEKVTAPKLLTKPKRADFKNSEDYWDALYAYDDAKYGSHGNVGKVIVGLDSVLERTRLPEGIVVYRGISSSAFNRFVKKAKQGGTFTDKGFVSTSLEQETARGFGNYLLAIRIPKGMKALPVGSMGVAGEKEVIIARGAKFKVLRIAKNRVVVSLVKTGAKSKALFKQYSGEFAKVEATLDAVQAGLAEIRELIEKKKGAKLRRRGKGGKFEEHEHPRDKDGKFIDKPDVPQFVPVKDAGPAPKPGYEKPPKPVVPRGGASEIEPQNSPFKPTLKPPSQAALEYDAAKPVPGASGWVIIEEGTPGYNPKLADTFPGSKAHFNTNDGKNPGALMDSWDAELGIKSPTVTNNTGYEANYSISPTATKEQIDKAKTYDAKKPKPGFSANTVIYEGQPGFDMGSVKEHSIKTDTNGLKYHYNTPSGALPLPLAGLKHDGVLGIKPVPSLVIPKSPGVTSMTSPALTGDLIPPAGSKLTGNRRDEFGRLGKTPKGFAFAGTAGNRGLSYTSFKDYRDSKYDPAYRQLANSIRDSSTPKGLSGDAIDGFGIYTTNKYRAINAYHRGTGKGPHADEPLTADDRIMARRVTQQLDSAFANASLSEGLLTYRGMGGEGWKKMQAAGMKPGKVFTDLGYVSTSFRQDFAEDWQHGGVLMAIRIPKGMKALPLGSYSRLPSENEVLIARGAKFRVISIEKVGGSSRMVLQLLKTGSKSSKTIKSTDSMMG